MNTHTRWTGAATVAALTLVLVGCSAADEATADLTPRGVVDATSSDTALGSYVVEPTLDNFSACTDVTAIVRVIGGAPERLDVEVVEVLKGDLAAGDVVQIVQQTALGGPDALDLVEAGDLLVTITDPGIDTGGDDDYFAWGAHLILADGSLVSAQGGDTVTLLDAPSAPATLADARAVVASVVAGEVTCGIA